MGPIGSKVIEVKGQICFFFCLFLPGPWADLHQTWSEGLGWPQILARGVHFLKVKVIEVKGQISVSQFVPPRSLSRSSPNLVGRLRAAPDISSRGSFFKGQGHRGQRSNFCISAVLGPICMKLGECIQVDP